MISSLKDGALILAALLALAPIALRAWQAARVWAFSIDLLVTIAVIGALIIGEYVEAAVVSFLFLFGAYLEARSLARTRSYLQGLISLAPTRATVRRTRTDGEPERVTIDAGDLVEGDLMLITTGERVAADGVVTTGRAEVDEATITGEPLPVTKQAGDSVYAGTVLTGGYMEASATKVGADTTFNHIITLVEEAQETRTPTMRFLERFARIYTPAVIVFAVIVFAFTRDVEFALTFLVIACPGALVISVPVAIVAGVGNLAKSGVLITSGEALENLAKADVVMVDKTGTLTRGEPVVAESLGVEISEPELLRLAASVEVASEHHLARAIVAAAETGGVELAGVDDVVVTPGVGVSGQVDGQTIQVGKLPADTSAAHTDEIVSRWEDAGMTAVYVTSDKLLGVIAITDAIRPESAGTVAELRKLGIDEITMLTGDNHAAATEVARLAGLDGARAKLLPQDKAEIVAARQADGHKVIMVGDGVNDAPALATASVGVAMGGAGTDVSQATADVVLMTDRLDHLAHARRISKATANVMMQNTVIALGTVGLLIAGVLARHVGLAGGMLVHELSVIAVVLNALRIVRMGQTKTLAPSAAAEREKELV